MRVLGSDGRRGLRAGFVVLLALGGVARADVTEFLGPLRDHDAKIAAAHAAVVALTGGTPPAGLRERGKTVLDEAKAFAKTLAAFQESETRRGLDEEYDLLRSSLVHVDEAAVEVRRKSGAPPPSIPPAEVETLKTTLRDLAVDILKSRLAERFESEGLRDILMADSWDEAYRTALDHGHRKLREYVENETERLVGLRFHDLKSLGRALRERLRHEVRRHVAKLLVKITTNEIVVDFLAEALIRWIGPKLKEALRNKGDLPERTERSLETLEEARRALNAFTGDAKVADVQRAVRRAEGAVAATKFLVGDLERAQEAGLLAGLAEGTRRLKQTVSLTRRRFFLDKEDHREDLAAARAALAEIVTDLEKVLATLPETAAATPSGRKVHHLFLPQRAPDEVNRRLGGIQKPWHQGSVEILPAYCVADLDAHEKQRELRRKLEMPDPGPIPEYGRARVWYVVKAKCAGTTAYGYGNASARPDFIQKLGRARVYGLASGRHEVSVTVVTADGVTLSESVPVEIALPPERGIDYAAKNLEARTLALAKFAPGAPGSTGALDGWYQAADSRRMSLAARGGTEADLLALATQMVERSAGYRTSDTPKGTTPHSKEMRRLSGLQAAALLCADLGTQPAYALVKRILSEIPAPRDLPSSTGAFGEDPPEVAIQHATAPIWSAAMHLAISASNDVASAKAYAETHLRAMGKSYVEQLLPDVQAHFPARIDVR